MTKGDAVEAKVRPGLGGWQRGTLVDIDDRTAWVRIGYSAELVQVPASRVRPAKGRRGAPEPAPSSRPKLARTPSYERPSGKPQPKPAKPSRSRAYLDHVRQLQCCSCGAPPPSDPHHFGPRGMGQKASDYRTSPLCRECHDHWHDHRCLPGMDAPESEVRLYRAQVDALVGWVER